MAGNPDQKLKLLHLLDILRRETDESHPLSAERLSEKLAERGVSGERKSIYADINTLIDFGYDIVCSKVEPRGYFLAYREFEVPEVCLLCDAVESADFISQKKTRELLDKLETLLSCHEAKRIHRHIFIDNRAKSTNEQTFRIIDCLSSAIDERKKVMISYRRHDLAEGKFVTFDREFTVSPYALAWVEDHYYLICNNEKYNNLMHLRVDRMVDCKPVKESVRPFQEVSPYKTGFDVADYVGKSFRMFGGEKKYIELKCANSLLDAIMDRFGEKISYRAADDDTFTFRTEAHVSEGLVGWIMQYGKDVEVLTPEELREQVAVKAKELYKIYE